MVSRTSLILLLGVFLIGCRPATPPPTPSDQTQMTPGPVLAATSVPATSPSVPEEAKKVLDAQYQLGATDALRVVQLTDGKFEQGTQGSADSVSVAVSNFIAVGDLNADGTNEIAALVSENYGGSGVFVFLAVYTSENGTLTFQNSTMVDDRPQLMALSIQGDEIF